MTAGLDFSKILKLILVGVLVTLQVAAPRVLASSQTIALTDNFTQDTSLNTSLWQIDGPVGRNVGLSFTPQPFTIVTPSLSFSNSYGIGISGVGNANRQFASIESVTAFTAPFTIQASVAAISSHGKPFGLIASWNGGRNSIGIFGNLNGTDGSFPYGISAWTGDDTFNSFLSTPALPIPAVNIPFSLTISLDTSGIASLTANTDTAHGSTSVNTCTQCGPFNVLLGQYIGGADLGPNLAYWRSVSVSALANSHSCSDSPIIGSGVSATSTVSLPSGGSTYIYAATIGGSFSISPHGFQQDLGVTNAQSYQSVIIGHSSSNTSSFNTNGALYPSIGAIGVACSNYQTKTFQNSGQNSISGSFNLDSNSFVVLASAASNTLTPSPQLSGPFTVDAVSSNGQGGQMIFAHANLTAGSYSFTIQYTPWNDPGQRGIGVMVYVFTPSAPASIPWFLFGLLAAAAAAIVVTVIALRSRKARTGKASMPQ